MSVLIGADVGSVAETTRRKGNHPPLLPEAKLLIAVLCKQHVRRLGAVVNVNYGC